MNRWFPARPLNSISVPARMGTETGESGRSDLGALDPIRSDPPVSAPQSYWKAAASPALVLAEQVDLDYSTFTVPSMPAWFVQ